jgi:small-conductance mechanosensitive channel
MDTQTIDQEFEQLQTEFQDVAKTVQGLAEKLQAAAKSGDASATEWLADLKQVAQDIDDEQTQAKVLLLAVHGLLSNVAHADAAEHPPLYAPGHEPQEAPQQQQQPAGYYQQRGGMMGGGMMGGGMMGGYFGGGFARAMEMGAGIGLGQTLISSIFR